MHEKLVPVLAVVYAKNLAAVAAFYEQALQLEPVEVEATHVLLRGSSAEVALIQAPEGMSLPIGAASPPALRTGTPLKLSFLVEGFARVREAVKLTGGSLNAQEAAWSWRDSLHLDGSDPEGNAVQFRVPMGSPPAEAHVA